MTLAESGHAQVKTSRETHGAVFAVLWACANVAHLLNQVRGGEMPVVSWINLACALWLMASPGSAHRLALLAGAQLLDTVWVAPYEPDHQLLQAFVNVTILMAYAALGRPESSSALVDRISPAARLLLLVAYGAAATAKYNVDFLTPVQSCASYMAHASSFGAIDRDSTLAVGYVVMTLVSETMIPILLIVPATRRWGVLYGCSFHFLVSLSPVIAVADFTTTLWALLFLFLPHRDRVEVGGRIDAALRRSAVLSPIRRVPKAALVALGVLAVFGGSFVHGGVWVYLSLWALVTAFGLTLLVSTARVLKGSRRPAPRLGRPTLGQIPVVLALAALVAGPYLGFGTSSRFTMFSGLRTEGAGTNHLFLPSVHLIESQNDYLIVLESHGDSRTLDIAAEQRAALPIVEINRILQDEQISATFQTLDGRDIVVKAGLDHPLRRSPNWWEAKTQHYRPFTVEGTTKPGFCSN